MSVTRSVAHGSKSELQRRIAAGSQKTEDYLDLSDILGRELKFEEAKTLLNGALTLDIGNTEKAKIAVELGRLLYYYFDEPSRAISLAEEAIKLLSNEPETWDVMFLRALGSALIGECLWITENQAASEAASTSLALLERLILHAQEFEEMREVQYEAARVCNLLRETDRAIQLCEDCLGKPLTDEQRLSCLIIYGQALSTKGQFLEAERVLKEALECVRIDERMLPLVHSELGSTYRNAGHFFEARESFVLAMNALRALPTIGNNRHMLSQLYSQIAELCYELEEHDKATRIFETVLQYHSESDLEYWTAVNWLGHCHNAEGNYDKARECFDRVIKSPYASDLDKQSARQGLT